MLCILQARMSSQRLPGKMMLNVKGRVLIGRVLDRLKHSRTLTKIIVATSDNLPDQSIFDFCTSENIQCFRGSLNNVTDRFKQVVEQEKAEAFVRINGDSPLIDPAIVDQAVRLFQEGEFDLVTNILPRTFPKGQSVEVICSKTFLEICTDNLTDEEKEHLTKSFYNNPSKYRIVSFTSGLNFSSINFCIDTIEDLKRIEKIIELSGSNPGTWRELSTIYQTL